MNNIEHNIRNNISTWYAISNSIYNLYTFFCVIYLFWNKAAPNQLNKVWNDIHNYNLNHSKVSPKTLSKIQSQINEQY